jgi:general secretion pathway protein M
VTLRERWTALSGRERALILGAVVIAVLVVARYSPLGSLAVLSSGGGEDDRWVQVRKIENYHKILAEGEAVRAQSQALRDRYDRAQSRLISGTTPTQVGAELQGRLSSMAAEAGLNVLSSQILKEEEVEGFRRIGVRLTLSGELEGVARMVAAIESGQSDLAVSLLEVNRKLGATRRPTNPNARTPAGTPIAQAPLTATMEVKTFMQQAAS